MLLFLSSSAAPKSCVFSCEKREQAVTESLISHFTVLLLFSPDCPQFHVWQKMSPTWAGWPPTDEKFWPQGNQSVLRTTLPELQLWCTLCFSIFLETKNSTAPSLGGGKNLFWSWKSERGTQRKSQRKIQLQILTLWDILIKRGPSQFRKALPLPVPAEGDTCSPFPRWQWKGHVTVSLCSLFILSTHA